jgi:hypothetical protein
MTVHMRARRKKPVTVSLSEELIELVDQVSKELKETRSGIIEGWLLASARQHTEAKLAREYEEYVNRRSSQERSEDEALAQAMGQAARRIDYDNQARKPRGRRKR